MKAAEEYKKRRWRLLYKISNRLLRLGTSWDCAEVYHLTLEQLEFINHRLELPCCLAACPGSGKTEVVGIKAAYEFSTWDNPFFGIAILTFTKNAAGEIRDRVMKYGGLNAARHPHFIGTFDSWLHSYVFQPFGYSYVNYRGRGGDRKIGIIDNDSRAEFLQAFMTGRLNGTMPVIANQFSFNAEDNPETSSRGLAAIVENLDNREALKNCKEKFWKSGFATYQDAEFISYKILATRKDLATRIARRFPVVIVDECQDLSSSELKLLDKLQSEGVSVHLVGDLDQAIYEFRNVDPKLVREYSEQRQFIKKGLTNNFRSNQEIVDVCRKIIGKGDAIKGTGDRMLAPACVLYEYTDLAKDDLAAQFRQLIDTLGLNPNQCAILARGRATLAKVAPQSDGARKPVELFAAALNSYYGTSRNSDDLTNALEQIGKCLAYLAFKGKGNHQQQYCPDEIDPVHWRLFLWNLLQCASGLFPFEENGTKLSWSDWVARLKEFLREQWGVLPVSATAWDAVQTKLRAPTGTAEKKVSDTLLQVQRVVRVRTTTIHDVKGETLDAVLLVSSPDKRSRGGHYEQWLSTAVENEEHRRFAYVACSRPRHLLIIAAKKGKADEKKGLIGLGLAPVADLASAISRAAIPPTDPFPNTITDSVDVVPTA